MVSYKEKLRDCYKDWGRYKSQAKKLTPWIKENFAQEKLFEKFSKSIDNSNDSIVIL